MADRSIPEAEAFVLRMREQGALSVQIGDVGVVFGRSQAQVAAPFQFADLDEDDDEGVSGPERRKREEEELLYGHTEG